MIEWTSDRPDHAERLVIEKALLDALQFVNVLQREDGSPEISGLTNGAQCRLAEALLKRLREGGLVTMPLRPPVEKAMIDGWPRRNRMDHWTEAETAIQAAVDVVERAGADVRLTDAVTYLAKARESVADFVDGQVRS